MGHVPSKQVTRGVSGGVDFLQYCKSQGGPGDDHVLSTRYSAVCVYCVLKRSKVLPLSMLQSYWNQLQEMLGRILVQNSYRVSHVWRKSLASAAGVVEDRTWDGIGRMPIEFHH